MENITEKNHVLELLKKVQSGQILPEQALLNLRTEPFEDLDYAKVDFHRGIRQGVAEVIYGQSKTKDQILGIINSMKEKGIKDILVTRLSKESAEFISQFVDFEYDFVSKIGVAMRNHEKLLVGSIIVASGGTSDISVCEEAAITAEVLGNKVTRLYDVGVSGLNRLLSYRNLLMTARVIITVAGMEGALASVIGGLVDCPVIAVPTSIGYGANFGGLSALLSMLNSCASGVSVVNIDNGFGAGYLANMINKMEGIK